MIVVVALIVGIATFVAIRQRKKKETAYRSWFFIGLCWVSVGIVFKNPFFSIMGATFLTISLLNKDKWKQEKKWSELTRAEKNLKIILISVAALLLIVGSVVYLIQRNKAI